jgi:hypothetical protein
MVPQRAGLVFPVQRANLIGFYRNKQRRVIDTVRYLGLIT